MYERGKLTRFTPSSLRAGGSTLTLGARELALLLARGNGTVNVVPEGSIGEVVDLVVGLDVLLNSLTAGHVWSAQAPRHSSTSMTRCVKHQQLQGMNSPRSIAVLQLQGAKSTLAKVVLDSYKVGELGCAWRPSWRVGVARPKAGVTMRRRM